MSVGAAGAHVPDRLILSFDCWEGPLDLLLRLARTQRIDLAAIPIGPLVDQYLAFVARALRLEVAADHLVMAAWLAYLKSALLLPPEARPEPDPQDQADALRWRLQRLAAMRGAVDALVARPMGGRDTRPRGMAQGLRRHARRHLDAGLYDLLAAYGAAHARHAVVHWAPHDRGPLLTLEQALARLAGLVGALPGWADLSAFLPPAPTPAYARSALAASFAASLELARTGAIELEQDEPFGAIRLRRAG